MSKPFYDGTDIQDALNTGSVLGPYTYVVDKSVVIPPGKYLKGSGRGQTIIKLIPSPVGQMGVILLSNGTGVSDLTTNSRDVDCNGIVAESINHAEIINCEVLCKLSHTYSIWSHLSSNVLIKSCSVDGGADKLNNSVPQEGIEVFGGNDVTIDSCYITKMGRGGISLFQSLGAVLARVTIKNCLINECSIGSNTVVQQGCRLEHAVFNDCVFKDNAINDIFGVCNPDAILDVSYNSCVFKTVEIQGAGKWTNVKFTNN